jgi:dTDP-glucose pyrophosphorylase
MNVLIPMAGAGSRFKEAGYVDSKPLIDVNGLPMIARVIDNIGPLGRYIFVVRQDIPDYQRLVNLLQGLKKDCVIVKLNKLTEGAAQTCLFANDILNGELERDSLLIANCDQIQDWSYREFEKHVNTNCKDGCIITYESIDEKNSFVTVDDDGFVLKAVEKQRISNIATTGVYYWSKGCDFVRDAKSMIEKNTRTNNEFYVCPVYNETINNGGKISIFHIKQHWPLGIPEDLQRYLDK